MMWNRMSLNSAAPLRSLKCFICKRPKFSFICIMKPRPQGGKMNNFEDVCKKHYRQWMKGKYKRIRRKAEKAWRS